MCPILAAAAFDANGGLFEPLLGEQDAAIARAGFDIKPGEHPIVPIMVHEATQAQQLAARLMELRMVMYY